jgi:CBS domain containing-hemolysin-like protein
VDVDVKGDVLDEFDETFTVDLSNPVNVAIADPDRTALWLALPMRGFTVMFRPLIRLLNAMASAGLRVLGV